MIVDELRGGGAESLLASLLLDSVVIFAICSDIAHGSLSLAPTLNKEQ